VPLPDVWRNRRRQNQQHQSLHGALAARTKARLFAIQLLALPHVVREALELKEPGNAQIESVPEPAPTSGELLLKVRMVGFCGSDLKSFRGQNPLISFPRILGHEVAATIVDGSAQDPNLRASSGKRGL